MPHVSEAPLVDLLVKETDTNRLAFFKILFTRTFSVAHVLDDLESQTSRNKSYKIQQIIAKANIATRVAELRDYLSVSAPEGKVSTERDREVMAMYNNVSIINRVQKKFVDLIRERLTGTYSLDESPIELKFEKDTDLLLAVNLLIHTFAKIIYANEIETTSNQVARLKQYKAVIETSRGRSDVLREEFLVTYIALQKSINDKSVRKDFKELAIFFLEIEIQAHAPCNKARSFLVNLNERIQSPSWNTKGITCRFWTFEKTPDGIVELRTIFLPLAEKLCKEKIQKLTITEVQPIFEQILFKLRSKAESTSWTRKAQTADFYKEVYQQAQCIYDMEFTPSEKIRELSLGR